LQYGCSKLQVPNWLAFFRRQRLVLAPQTLQDVLLINVALVDENTNLPDYLLAPRTLIYVGEPPIGVQGEEGVAAALQEAGDPFSAIRSRISSRSRSSSARLRLVRSSAS
jgi:hypothetical protein